MEERGEVIKKSQFLTLMGPMCKDPYNSDQFNLGAIFDSIDVDDSGKIDVVELHKIMSVIY